MIPVRPFALAVLLAPTLAMASGGGPVVFHGHGFSDPIGRKTEIFRDGTAQMGAAEVLARGRFTPADRDIPNLGVSSAAHWVRFDLANRSVQDEVILLIQYPEIGEIDVYAIWNGHPVSIGRGGQRRPADRLAQRTPLYGFRVPVSPGATTTVLVRIRSLKQVQLPLLITDPGSFQHYAASRNSWIGGFIGVMLVMAVYNLFIYFSIRDRSYLYYVLYIALVCATQTSFLGWLGFHVQPFSPWFAASASLLLTCFTAVAAGVFMQRFLRVGRHVPSYRKALIGFSLVMLACVVLVVIGKPLTAYEIAQVCVGAFAFYQVFIAEKLRRRGSRPAAFFLLAWGLFLAGVVVFLLKDKGVLPFNAFTNYTMPVGSVAEVVLLSFGLADKINILRRDKERSQAEALRVSRENERIIREQNLILEQKVDERTQELRMSNEHLKRTQTQLVNAEKMASLGQLTAGIAHEINNPVNFITSNIPPLRRNMGEILEVLQQYRTSGIEDPRLKAIASHERDLGLEDSISEITDILGSIEEGAGRTAEIVRGLRNFSRLDESDLKPADINEGLRSTLTVLGPQWRDQLRIDLDLGLLPPVECYPGKLNQVFMNMLTNAAQAVKARHPAGGGMITIATRVEGDHLIVRIIDNGVGMIGATMARMFEPFFTTKGVGEGTGLGLSIAYGIVEKHHGRIEADSTPGVGSEFRVILPLTQPTQMTKRA